MASRQPVVLMCGLPASGKTTTAERIHRRVGGVLIRSCDVYRDLGISLPTWVELTRRFTVGVGAYEGERDRAYDEMARQLETALAATEDLVVVDAVHGEPAKRARVYALCERHARTPLLVWCRCDSAAEVARRFAVRRNGGRRAPEDEADDLSVFDHIAGLWTDPSADATRDGRPRAILVHDTLGGGVTVLTAPAADFHSIRAALGAEES